MPASLWTFTRKLRQPCSMSSGLAGLYLCFGTRLSGLMLTSTRTVAIEDLLNLLNRARFARGGCGELLELRYFGGGERLPHHLHGFEKPHHLSRERLKLHACNERQFLRRKRGRNKKGRESVRASLNLASFSVEFSHEFRYREGGRWP